VVSDDPGRRAAAYLNQCPILFNQTIEDLRRVGACEAPRGTLFHHYWIDADGLMRKANLLIATSQNNLAMNRAVEQTAKHFVLPHQLREGMLNRVEAAIRCYDPCLSCSTHNIEVRSSGAGQRLLWPAPAGPGLLVAIGNTLAAMMPRLTG